MTKEEIIRMAKNSGLFVELVLERDLDWLERFAALVASAERESLRESFRVVTAAEACAAILHEREACAKVCEEGIANADDWNSAHWDQACENRAWAIRARGQA